MRAPENPAAFPQHPSQMVGSERTWGEPGMSLRDWFAGQALVGLLSSGKWDNCGVGFEAFISERASLIADAMLAERVTSGSAVR